MNDENNNLDLGEIKKDLTNQDYSIRAAAVKRLGSSGSEEAPNLLIEIIEKEDSTFVISRAIEALGATGSPSAFEFLEMKLLSPPLPGWQIWKIPDALYQISPNECIRVINQFFSNQPDKSKDNLLIQHCNLALGKHHEARRNSVKDIIRQLDIDELKYILSPENNSSDSLMKGEALDALGVRIEPEICEYLAQLITNNNGLFLDFEYEFLKILGNRRCQNAIEIIENTASNGYHSRKALANIGTPRSAELLIREVKEIEHELLLVTLDCLNLEFTRNRQKSPLIECLKRKDWESMIFSDKLLKDIYSFFITY